MLDVVGHVSQDRDAHDEQVELYIVYLPLELLNGGSLQNGFDFLLFLGLLGQLLFLGLFLSLALSILHG